MQVTPRAPRALDRAGAAAAALWLAGAALVTGLQRTTGHPAPAALASTPARIADGQAWRLLTSTVPVSRYPAAELAGCALAVAAAVALLGGVRFWLVALSAHVGSAIAVYAAIALTWLVDPDAVAGVLDEDDYGISAVWLGAVGAIAAVLRRRGRTRAAVALVAAAVLACLALAVESDGMVVAEHLVALTIGAVVGNAVAETRPAAVG